MISSIEQHLCIQKEHVFFLPINTIFIKQWVSVADIIDTIRTTQCAVFLVHHIFFQPSFYVMLLSAITAIIFSNSTQI